MELIEMSYTDVKAYLAKSTTVIIPLGAVEQHGPALPLGADAIIAEALARELGRRTDRLTAPLLSPGLSLAPHMNFPGTISFMPDTFTHMVRDFITTLHHHGLRNFLLINGHGGNDGCIKNALSELRFRLPGLKCSAANWWDIPAIDERARTLTGRPVGHADWAEASLVLHICPALVKRGRFTREFSAHSFEVSNDLAPEFLTRTGLMNADQGPANADLGAELFEMALNFYKKSLKILEAA
jgi:creatinine amidohydrolase